MTVYVFNLLPLYRGDKLNNKLPPFDPGGFWRAKVILQLSEKALQSSSSFCFDRDFIVAINLAISSLVFFI